MSITSNHQTERNALIHAMRQRTKQLEREGFYWTDDEKQQLKTLFYENIGITDIALILQRTEVAVMQQIQLLNLYEKVRRTAAAKRHLDCLCHRCRNKTTCQVRDFCRFSEETTSVS